MGLEKVREKLKDDVFYLLSLPRLAFTDNMFSVTNSVACLDLNGRYSTSAFWYQGIESLLEAAMDKGYKYALTIDFDTWFTEHHIIDLYMIMERHPELMALIPLQPRRGHPYPMAGKFTDDSGDEINLTKGEFKDGIYETDTGHFGLTLFRMSELKKLSKPWLRSQPDMNGPTWGDGKKDADIYFWIKAKREGLKIALAEVYIGHIQLLCSFTGTKEKKFKTTYVPMQAIFDGKMPSWIEPKCFSIDKKGKNK